MTPQLPCEADPDAWFGSVSQRARAIVMCGPCPLNAACFEYALANEEKHGVWGGMDFTRDQQAADLDMFPRRVGRPPKKRPVPVPLLRVAQ